MVESSSQNRAVSVSSEAHPLGAHDTSCQHPIVIIPSWAVLQLFRDPHLRVIQCLRAIPAGGPT